MKKTLLLTGGTGKFGQVLARYFCEKGWDVVTTSREKSRLDSLIANIGLTKGSIIGIAVDLQKPGMSQWLVDELSSLNISITHLVNNARSLETLSINSDGTTSRDSFMSEFEFDVVVPYELSMSLSSSLKHKMNAIVNIGSMYGEVAPNPSLYDGTLDKSPVQYGVSKAALHHLTRELSVRLAPKNIRVNCVAFGGVEGRVDQEFIRRYAQLVPSRRMLKDSELIGPVEFLLEEASSAINGHVMLADGGWSVW